MTVESNCVIAIATLSDWLKRLEPNFQPMRSKTKINHTIYKSFFPRFERVTGTVIARNCDWFIALFAPAVIALVLVFRQSFENHSN